MFLHAWGKGALSGKSWGNHYPKTTGPIPISTLRANEETWALERGTQDSCVVSAHTFTALAWRSQATSGFTLPPPSVFKWPCPTEKPPQAFGPRLSSWPPLKNQCLLRSCSHSLVFGTVKVRMLRVKQCDGLSVCTFSTPAHPQSDGMRRRGLGEDEVTKAESLGWGWCLYTKGSQGPPHPFPPSDKLQWKAAVCNPKGSSAEPAPPPARRGTLVSLFQPPAGGGTKPPPSPHHPQPAAESSLCYSQANSPRQQTFERNLEGPFQWNFTWTEHTAAIVKLAPSP